jgi:geranylgeranyl pyrophosphate synthase
MIRGSRSRVFELGPFLQNERARVGQALDRALDRMGPVLAPPLQAPIRQGVRTGGKRLRPILCVAAYRACGGIEVSGTRQTESLYDLAVSLELVHAYSLMHDDLPCMDDAPLRRGMPTPHVVHGERAAILAGAALIPAAALQIWLASRDLGLDGGTARELVGVLCRAAGASGMVGGQALDLLGEGASQLTREAMDELHGRKTGALLAASLVMGSTAARAPTELCDALARYGKDIGLAFQIADDVLDATADAGTLGKHPSDHELEKSTYVALLGVEGARREGRTKAERAVAALSEVGLRSVPLEELARYVVQRER